MHVVVTADEIESFMHVILYNGVRYLPFRHPLTRGELIKRYFIDSDKRRDGGGITCGEQKRLVITKGSLTISGEELLFGDHSSPDTPLNQLFQVMLGLFQARYEVLAYDIKAAKQKEEAANILTSTSDSESSSVHPPTPPPTTKGDPLMFTRPVPSRFDFDTERRAKTAPSQETRDKAKKLEDHAETLDIFIDVLSNVNRWPIQLTLDHNTDVVLPIPSYYGVQLPYCALEASMSSYCETGSTGQVESLNQRVFPLMESSAPPQRKKLRVATGAIADSFRAISGSSPLLGSFTGSVN